MDEIVTEEIVLETVPLTGSPWPTVDPFLFCVHHDDAYPTGNGHFGPDASLAGREMGADFAGVDGLAHVPRHRGAGVSRSTRTGGSRPSPTCGAA